MQEHQFVSVINNPNLPMFFYDILLEQKTEPLNWHEFMEVVFVVEGEGEILFDSAKLPIRKNEFCLIEPYSPHRPHALSDNFHMYNLGISNDFCNYNGLDIQNYRFRTLFQDPVLKEKIQNLCNAYHNTENVLYYASICNILFDLALYLVENHSVKRDSALTKYRNIYLAVGFIKSHLHEELTVESIAKQVGLSKSHFSREFKKLTGYSIIDYVNLLRCQEVCQYLKSQPISVHEAYQMSAFKNYTHFSTMFKKYVGKTPAEFLKTIQTTIHKTEQ